MREEAASAARPKSSAETAAVRLRRAVPPAGAARVPVCQRPARERYASTVSKLRDARADVRGPHDRTLAISYWRLAEGQPSRRGRRRASEWQDDVSSGGQGVFGRELVVLAVTPGTGEPYEMAVRLFR